MLSILGPLAFAFSVWGRFPVNPSPNGSRRAYISVYLWLPVSDLFSCMLAKIQVLMLQNDIAELQSNPEYSIDNLEQRVHSVHAHRHNRAISPSRPWRTG